MLRRQNTKSHFFSSSLLASLPLICPPFVTQKHSCTSSFLTTTVSAIPNEVHCVNSGEFSALLLSYRRLMAPIWLIPRLARNFLSNANPWKKEPNSWQFNRAPQVGTLTNSPRTKSAWHMDMAPGYSPQEKDNQRRMRVLPRHRPVRLVGCTPDWATATLDQTTCIVVA